MERAKAALAHAQFETIHPFLDGNGRVGRLLITLLPCAEEVLREPLLYLSLHFKQNRDAYYDNLQRVRTDGAWEEWLVFFLEGVIAVASSATETARRIRALVDADRARAHGLGRRCCFRTACTRARRPSHRAQRDAHSERARSQRPHGQRGVGPSRGRRAPPRGHGQTARAPLRLRRLLVAAPG